MLSAIGDMDRRLAGIDEPIFIGLQFAGGIRMNSAIEAGDRVRHKNRNINGGLDMPVEEISKNQALCIYLDLKDDKYKEGWFDLRDLELASKAEDVKKTQKFWLF